MLSMYPGGAMMFCESVAQFDENLKMPASMKVAPLTESALASTDAVLDTIQQLGPTYEHTVKPLLSMELSYDKTDEAVYKLEMVRNAMSRICHLLMRVITDLASASSTFISKDQYAMTSFSSHIGLYMRHASKVKREGLTEWPYEVRVIRPLAQGWSVSEAVAAFVGNPSMLNELVTRDVLEFASRSNGIGEIFDGFIDMMNCLYMDHDRRIRLEKRETRTLNFESMMNCENCFDDRCAGADQRMNCVFNQFMSRMMRTTFMESYDLLCAVMDNTITPSWFRSVFTDLVYRTVNMYGLGTMLAFSLAYQIQAEQTRLIAYSDYDKRLMEDLQLEPKKPAFDTNAVPV